MIPPIAPGAVRRDPIIALAEAPWGGPWGTVQQLVSRLARNGRTVVYSTGPLSVWNRQGSDWSGSSLRNRALLSDHVLIDRPGRLCATWPKSSLWSRLAYGAHARHLCRLISDPGKATALIFHPQYAHYVDLLALPRVVYFAYDQYNAMAGWTDDLARQESNLVARADHIFAVTPEIAAHLPTPGRDKAHILANAVDAHAFASGKAAPCPIDLAAIPTPRIGYVGRMTPKVDFELVARVASRRPEWHWVMVGPVLLEGAAQPEAERIARDAYAQCRTRSNVHFLGTKHHRELPQYMAHIHVNTMCYRSSGGWWVSGSPLKLFEYLAVANPIVGTPLPALRPYASVVDLAEGEDAWICAIERGLAGGIGSAEQRRAIAFDNSWDKRISELERRLA